MAISLNVRFAVTGLCARGDEHAAGGAIAGYLCRGISEAGWSVTTIDNWHDSGWSFRCGREKAQIEIIVARMADEHHFVVQIAPSFVPGFLQRLFGRKPSASPTDVYEAAQDVHDLLAKNADFSEFRWSWDSIPTVANATPTPAPAS